MPTIRWQIQRGVSPLNKREREREGEERRGAIFHPSIKHISIHSFIRLLNVINHYIFLPAALPF
jgi:hypothetical protein